MIKNGWYRSLLLYSSVFAWLFLSGVPVLGARKIDGAQTSKGYVALTAEGQAASSCCEAAESFKAALECAPANERRNARYRWADSAWRCAAGLTGATDDEPRSISFTAGEKDAWKALEELSRGDDKDWAYAMAHVSMGQRLLLDTGPGVSNYASWPHFRAALAWWLNNPQAPQARDSALSIGWQCASALEKGQWRNMPVPVKMAEQILALARDDQERSRASFLVALALAANSGSPSALVRETFERALAAGPGTSCYVAALFHYAAWEADGRRADADCNHATALFDRLAILRNSDSMLLPSDAIQWLYDYAPNAQWLSVGGAFRPGTRVTAEFCWKGGDTLDCALAPIDLAKSPLLARVSSEPASRWHLEDLVARFDIRGLASTRRWKDDLTAAPPCSRVNKRLDLGTDLAAGAYVLTVAGSGGERKAIVLVEDAALLVRRAAAGLVLFACGLDGAPLPGAFVRVIAVDSDWHAEATTSSDGIARIDIPEGLQKGELVAMVSAGTRQALAAVPRLDSEEVLVSPIYYVFTDRPAYRPKETVYWKTIVRDRSPEGLTTPSGRRVGYRVLAPNSTIANSGTVTLDQYGSAWGEFALGATAPVGVYRVVFGKPAENDKRPMQGWEESETASFFRVEEFRLSEFQVKVRPAMDASGAFLAPPGALVPTEVAVERFSGEPLGGVAVAVKVVRRPFLGARVIPSAVPWRASDNTPIGSFYEAGNVVQEFHGTTGSDGRVRFGLQVPEAPPKEAEYQIVAEATDNAGRVGTGQGRVWATTKPCEVSIQLEHSLLRSAEEVRVDLLTLDHGGRPIPARGTVSLLKRAQQEVWTDPQGREMKGEELEAYKKSVASFPPQLAPGEGQWRQTGSWFEEFVIAQQGVSTDVSGRAALRFSPPGEGAFVITWRPDKADSELQTDRQTFLVVGKDSTPLLLDSGFGLFLSREAARPGEKVRALITTPAPGARVLIAVDGARLHGEQVVTVPGTASLVDLEIEESDSPCATVAAYLLQGRAFRSATKTLEVPAFHRSLEVKVEPDREVYGPGDEGHLRVSTRDALGHPVAAQVALSVADEAVYAIQDEFSPDPRKVFLDWRRTPDCVSNDSFRTLPLASIESSADENEMSDIARPRAHIANGVRVFVADTEGHPMKDVLLSLVWGGGFQRLGRTNSTGEFLIPAPLFGEERILRAAAKDHITLFVGGLEIPDGAELLLKLVLPRGDSLLDTHINSPLLPVTHIWSNAPRIVGEGGVLGGVEGGIEGGVLGGVLGSSLQGSRAPVVVRHDFSPTALWKPALETGPGGETEVAVRFPESLTAWRATARAATTGDSFGMATASVKTAQQFSVSLATPRFLVAGDRASVSAVVHNGSARTRKVKVWLDVKGVDLGAKSQTNIDVPAGGSAPIRWLVKAVTAGEATFRLSARSGSLSDGMEGKIPVLGHGVLQRATAAGATDAEKLNLELDLPGSRAPGSTTLQVQVSSGPAAAALSALPYLANYPYGCAEQTMSRFLPSAALAKTLGDHGYPAESVDNRLATVGPGQRGNWTLRDMVTQGMSRLLAFRHKDGGWGWYENDATDTFMSAYVLDGLCLARQSGYQVDENILKEGQHLLESKLLKETNPEIAAWVLSAAAACQEETHSDPQAIRAALESLWKSRETLKPQGLALLGLSAHRIGVEDRVRDVALRLGELVQRDEEKGTAWWGQTTRWWHWTLNPVETTALAMRVLLLADPKDPLVEPAMTYLLAARCGAQWSTTRDTALSVLALSDYLKTYPPPASTSNMAVEINGRPAHLSLKGNQESALRPSIFTSADADLHDGKNMLLIRRLEGRGKFHATAIAESLADGEPLPATTNGFLVERRYILHGDGQKENQTGLPLHLAAGSLVDCLLTVTSNDDADYFMIEDPRPAGLEPVWVKSGETLWATGDGGRIALRTEVRDTRTAFFAVHLPKGTWQIRYPMRAETAGSFHVLPAQAMTMYSPERCGNSSEARVEVNDIDAAPREH